MKGGVKVLLLCVQVAYKSAFWKKGCKMFHNVELLSWGSSERPIQMHCFLENPLGSKHIAKTF